MLLDPSRPHCKQKHKRNLIRIQVMLSTDRMLNNKYKFRAFSAVSVCVCARGGACDSHDGSGKKILWSVQEHKKLTKHCDLTECFSDSL